MLIGEMLLLVAADDKGHVPAGSDAFVKVGLAGALLAELAIDGQLTVGDDGRVRTADTRPGDELLADVYDAVRDHLEGRKARQVIGGLGRHIGGSRDRVVDRLAGALLAGTGHRSCGRPGIRCWTPRPARRSWIRCGRRPRARGRGRPAGRRPGPGRRRAGHGGGRGRGGRRVYANIRRFLLYALSGAAAEIAVMLAGPFLGLALPLLPAQILWVNLLTHGLPQVALGSEPADPGAMRRPPRPPAESVLGAGLWQRIARVGSHRRSSRRSHRRAVCGESRMRRSGWGSPEKDPRDGHLAGGLPAPCGTTWPDTPRRRWPAIAAA